jgi:general secretion pathway protein K
MIPSQANQGFILVMTLAILTASLVVLGAISIWVERTLEIVGSSKTAAQDAADAQSTMATVLYLLCTQRMTIAGLTMPESSADTSPQNATAPVQISREYSPDSLEALMDAPSIRPLGNELPLDDTPLQGVGDVLFGIQDEGGLQPILLVEPQNLYRLLGVLHVPFEDRYALISRLRDYMDKDDLVRINGAEREEYLAAGKPPPPNRSLLTTWEIQSVLGFEDLHDLPRLCSLYRAGLPNVNTAPVEVLQVIPGIDKITALRILETRKKNPVLRPAELDAAAGKLLHIDFMDLNVFPLNSLRITLWVPGRGAVRTVHLRLLPMSNRGAPFDIEHALALPANPDYHAAHGKRVENHLFADNTPAD